MPKVSVVIPTYNRAHLIGETIQSVLDQTFHDFEVIVIDDGSTDNTHEIVSKFPVEYFRQENRGPAAARNTGIKLSCGEYIAFLDSDDLFLRPALENGVKALDKYTEAGFSFGEALKMDEMGRIFGLDKSTFLQYSSLVDGKELIREILTTYRIRMGTVMIRRCCLDKVGGFNEEMRSIAEDLHLTVRLAKRYSAAYVAEPLMKWRMSPGSLSHNIDPKGAERAFLLILKEIFEDADINPYCKPWRNKAYATYYRFIAGYAYGKDMKLTRQYLGKALVVHPGSILHKDGLSTTYMYAKSFLPSRLMLILRDLKSHSLWSHRQHMR
jgi:glycosyltransferase involved in cell wall biosynthesis